MSDKHLKSPDSKFETVKKDTTRESEYSTKNRQRNDEYRPKNERSRRYQYGEE